MLKLKDLQEIYKICVQECKNVDIPIRDDKVIKIEFTKEYAQESRGFCIMDNDCNTFSIFINSIYQEKDCPIEELKETIIHELIHTCPRCQSHGKIWMKYAKILNDKYGYELMTTKDYEAVFNKELPILHKYVCKTCGSFFNLRVENETYFSKDMYFCCSFCGAKYYEIN